MRPLNQPNKVDLEAAIVAGGDEQSSREENKASSTMYSSPQILEVTVIGVVDKIRISSFSECSMEVDDVQENKLHLLQSETNCRICHLGLDPTANLESGILIELGCSCKDDLAVAHKLCAEFWFKIKGNIICEICGSIALNVAGGNAEEVVVVEQWNEAATGAVASLPPQPESRKFWHGLRFLNFLLACVIFAFIISWLFQVNVPL